MWFSLFVRLFICLVACLFVCLILFSFVSFLISLLFDDRCSSECQHLDEYFDKNHEFYQILQKYSEDGCQIYAGSPLIFGHGFFDLVFAQPNGPKKDVKYMQEAQWFF